MLTETENTIENNIQIHLPVRRGVVLKDDLRKAVGAPSLKVLRGDVQAFCEKKSLLAQYDEIKAKHSFPLDFSVSFIQHLYLENCKIILINFQPS